MQESSRRKSSRRRDKDPFCVIHKVPSGDTPYVRAKHAQLVEKDPETAIVLFWKAINAGDRIDSALKDMAVVMKQLNRTEEAIEAIKSFRGLCSKQAQEPLDNVLIDLYKGNLGWAYMQKSKFIAAEVVYKKAQMIDPDANKACNLARCLIKQARNVEAHLVLNEVLQGKLLGSKDCQTQNRAQELMLELEPKWLPPPETVKITRFDLEDDFIDELEKLLNEWSPLRTKRLPIFEEISSYRNQLPS
ncbi:protein SULFUR DEFICIENCY-INDUCED 1 isoform X3 [Vitis vinifera]|uniref:protein SULFUR DEFICIENCY-INDUCED 1 isoform X3 n=1 Tax=Vitis vinifera TaxID=29760 RepID=UPI0028830EF2|nr:protein SULFUR DEFICIENCY-INDUCED 1 isoform X3 [Vitis vinifera]